MIFLSTRKRNIENYRLQTIRVKYKDNTSFSIRPGQCCINDYTNIYILTSNGFDKTVSGLSANTWYYVYIKSPITRSILIASDIEYSTAAPTFDESVHGYYHATNKHQRCIGFIYSNASNSIFKFKIENNKYMYNTRIETLPWSGGNVNTSTDVTCKVPINNMFSVLTAYVTYNSANAHVSVLTKGNSDAAAGYYLGYIDDSKASYLTVMTVETDSSKRITVKSTASVSCGIFEQGFLIPFEIYN